MSAIKREIARNLAVKNNSVLYVPLISRHFVLAGASLQIDFANHTQEVEIFDTLLAMVQTAFTGIRLG